MEKVTVGQLIECLEKFDKDLPVGVIGHFGEYFEFPIDSIRKNNTYIESRETRKRIKFDCVSLPNIDIGETPD